MTSLASLTGDVRAAARTDGAGAALARANAFAVERLGLDPARTVVADRAGTGAVGSAEATHAVLVGDDGAVVARLLPTAAPTSVDGVLARSVGPSSARDRVALPAGWRAEVDLLRASLLAGLLRRFVDHAREVVLHHARAWHEAPVESADQDPHTQARFGQAYAVLAAVESLVEEAHPRTDERVDDPAVADRSAVARHYVDRRAGEVVTDVIAVLGASSATRKLGLDVHWRALRGLGAALPPLAPLPLPLPR